MFINTEVTMDYALTVNSKRYGVVEADANGVYPGMYIFPERFDCYHDACEFAQNQARQYPNKYSYYVVHFDSKVTGVHVEPEVQVEYFF